MAKAMKKDFIVLYARDMNIAWGDDKRYWNWIKEKDIYSNGFVDDAELIKVCYLDARKKFDTSILDPGTKYEVAFATMVKDNAEGFDHPVKLGLVIPNVIEEERKVDFSKLEKNKWLEIPVGQFIASTGKMEIYLSETSGHWKKGIIIKGIVIRAMN
ncbi:Phloem protein 2-like protein [Melia azedarach]|uniref:Phloem protein 2-like protein n=1 Tax=Melia azedarach TaxID=155640 RepID=A0ACC1WTL2_MELAZ|nr:Phloem protein 2-like protein [Melia azedarach]